MRRVITVAEIYTAPVKSLAVQRRKAVQVGPQGIPEDRRFYLIDQRGRLLTQREMGRLTQIRASFDVASGQLYLGFPDAQQSPPAFGADDSKATCCGAIGTLPCPSFVANR